MDIVLIRKRVWRRIWHFYVYEYSDKVSYQALIFYQSGSGTNLNVVKIWLSQNVLSASHARCVLCFLSLWG